MTYDTRAVPPLRVLCIDDNLDVADSTAELLRVAGIEALACYSGEAALTQAAKFRPDLCLIDLNMPGMNGDELARRLGVLVKDAVLVAVTAMSDEASRRRILEAGFTLHLVKPVDPNRLLKVIEAFVRALPSGVDPD